MPGIRCWILFFIGTILRFVMTTSGQTTTVVAKAPVKPVKEREILSLHCEVWDMVEGNVMTISRQQNGKITTFTFDKGVVNGVDDRTYLAVRQLKGGSSVYFLTVTDVTKADEGLYECQVIQEGGFGVVSKQSVHIPIQYFPSEKPNCIPRDHARYKAGTVLVLNCSSTVGLPAVKIAWTRSGVDISHYSTPTIENGTVYSLLTVTLTEKDNDAVFMCLVSSSAFRGRENRCHIGPITVDPNPDFKYTSINMPPTLRPVPPPRVLPPQLDVHKVTQNITDECNEVCLSPPTVKYWILACSAAGALALIFLLSVMVLLIKYCSSSKETRPEQRRRGNTSKYHPTQEEIYTELEYRQNQRAARDANKLYMSLQKQPPQNPEQPQQPPQQLQPTEEVEEPEGRGDHMMTPTAHAGAVPTATPVVYKSHYV